MIILNSETCRDFAAEPASATFGRSSPRPLQQGPGTPPADRNVDLGLERPKDHDQGERGERGPMPPSPSPRETSGGRGGRGEARTRAEGAARPPVGRAGAPPIGGERPTAINPPRAGQGAPGTREGNKPSAPPLTRKQREQCFTPPPRGRNVDLVGPDSNPVAALLAAALPALPSESCTGSTPDGCVRSPLPRSLRRRLLRDRLRRVYARRDMPELDATFFRRIQRCGQQLVGGLVGLEAMGIAGTEQRRARYHGFETCKSVWSCPMCSARIRSARAAELTEAVTLYGHERVYMLTLTVRHEYGDNFASMADNIAEAFRLVRQGNAWKTMCKRYGLEHQVRAVEHTYGRNGWHPHLHTLWFLERALTLQQQQEMEARIFELWSGCVARTFGRHHLPSQAHGVRVTLCRDGNYLSKMGLEMTDPGGKVGRHQGRSPWEIAEDAADGDPKSVELWLEYVRGTKGHTALTGLTKVAKALGMKNGASDEQLCASDSEGSDTKSEENDAIGTVRWVEDKVWYQACARNHLTHSTVHAVILEHGSEAAARRIYELAGIPYDESRVLVTQGQSKERREMPQARAG